MSEMLEIIQDVLHKYEQDNSNKHESYWAEKLYWALISAHNELACIKKCNCEKENK